MSFSVRFLPEDRSWRSEESVDLAFAAASCGIQVELPCGSRTSCGKCRVRVFDGAPPATAGELRLLGADAVENGWRLACQLSLDGSATIEIPAVSRSVASKAFGDDALLDGFIPAVRDPHAFGLAVDVGSTTLAVALIQLSNGTVATSVSALNPQVRFGSDIMARISYAQDNADGTRQLHEALVTTLNAMVHECCEAAGIDVSQVHDSAFVGNPTMLHTLRNLDPTPLGQAPYQSMCESWSGSARSLDLALPESAAAYHPAGVRSHVGADAIAAMVATGIDRVEQPTLLIDLGTNSEVVLAWRDSLLCTSTSAGPAFEGANIHNGMRGAPGAIEEVRIRPSGSIHVRAVAGEVPRGICGSGLLDAVAELLRVGLLEPSGRMRSRSEPGGLAPPRLLNRVVEIDGVGRAVRLTMPTQYPVLVTAADVRQLQLVKASVAAGIRLLLERAGLRTRDLAAVLLAGGFGNYLRKSSAQAIGLVPAIEPELVRFVGNAAGAGARLLLIDPRARQQAAAIASKAQYVELAGLPAYANAFIEEMTFPALEVCA